MYNYYGKHGHVRVVAPEAHIIEQRGDITPYKFIETIGRTCYKSEDKITADSAVKFVQGLRNQGHYAMLEHLWVHLKTDSPVYDLYKAAEFLSIVTSTNDSQVTEPFDFFKFLTVTEVGATTYVSGPLRVFIELDDLFACVGRDKYLDFPEEIITMVFSVAVKFPELFKLEHIPVEIAEHSKWTYITEDKLICELMGDVSNSVIMRHVTHTIHFVCDRGVSHELVRHRPASFAQESTRYCNYGHDDAITVIKPFFFERDPDTMDNVLYDNSTYSTWLCSMEKSAVSYLNMIAEGHSPQEARSVLPNSLKTEVIVTATETEWQHIINLRYLATTGAPHPQMKEVMSIAVPLLVDASENRLHIASEDK